MRKFLNTSILSLAVLVAAMIIVSASASATTVETTVLPDPDAAQDREPAVIVQRLNSGADRVITSWIRKTAESRGQLRVASIDTLNPNGVWTKPALPCPFTNSVPHCDSTDTSGDPYLAENPYGSGIWPNRVYLAGASTKETSGENQISIWKSDNGGQSWENYAALSHAPDWTWVADKPSIAVSWQAQTLGQVYAAHLLVNCGNSNCDAGTQNSKIVITRVDTNTQLNVIDTGSRFTSSPIILAHTGNRDWLFVVWLNWDTNEIKVASSFDGFSSYTVTDPPISAGTLLGVGNPSNCQSNRSDAIWNGTKSPQTCTGLGARIGARSMLMARFNAISGTLGIVWHARETDDPSQPNFLSSDVKFVEFTPWTQRFGTRFTVTDSQTIGNPGAPTAGAQWNPALDYDSNGDYLVSYYDTRGTAQSSTQFNYVVRTARLTSGGLRTGEADLQVTPNPSNLLVYDTLTNGEYQDLWNWSGNWYAAFIQIGSVGDVAVARINP